jgi:DNA-binding transcriptional regulator YiaG
MAWVKGVESRPNFCGGGLHKITWHTDRFGTCSGHQCIWIFDAHRADGSLRSSWDKTALEILNLWLESKDAIKPKEVRDSAVDYNLAGVERESFYDAKFTELVQDLLSVDEREYSAEESSAIISGLRAKHGVSQRDFAKVFASGRTMVYSIENSRRKLTIAYLRYLKGKARAAYKL